MSFPAQYEKLTVLVLRGLARERGLRGYSSAKKAQLVAMLDAPVAAPCNDKLYFYSASRDVAPGRGVNEVVTDPSAYRELALIPHWRRILSNFHYCPFPFAGSTYNTIEHVFQDFTGFARTRH
jgi:hypothetical protein